MFKYLETSKSSSTVKKYKYLFQKWQEFSGARGMCDRPASYFTVALYLTHLLEQGVGYQSVVSTVYALKFFHESVGHEFLVTNPYIKGMMECARRLPRRRVNRKDPITADILIRVCEKFDNSISLTDIRDLAFMVVSYAGFFRYDDLSSIRAKDVKFFKGYMQLYIDKSKTDQYREGETVCISEGKTIACPVKRLKNYFDAAGIVQDSDNFIFRPLVKTKKGFKLINKNKSISYGRVRQCVLEKLRTIDGCKNLNIGLHSFRSGGATAAAGADVSDRCLKRHGRWKTDSSKDMYIVDALDKKLLVTQRIGL